MTYLLRHTGSGVYDEFSARESAYEGAALESRCAVCQKPLVDAPDRVVFEVKGLSPSTDIYVSVTHSGKCAKSLMRQVQKNRVPA